MLPLHVGSRGSRLAAALVACAAATACGGARDAADRRFEDLRAQISKVQADNDKFGERLGALEAASDPHTSAPPATPLATGEVERRARLAAVRVGDDIDESDDAHPADESDTDRPTVRAAGRQGATLDPAPSTAAAATDAKSAGDPKRAFDAAFALVKDKQYDRALEALGAFLAQFPADPRAENATYWRAECFAAKADDAHAIEQFEAVLARFPSGRKAPDALLRLARALERTGAKDKARATYARLRSQFPKSEAARQAPRE